MTRNDTEKDTAAKSPVGGAGGIAVVAKASDGDEAVPQVLSHRPDVVVMDIRMRKIFAYEAGLVTP